MSFAFGLLQLKLAITSYYPYSCPDRPWCHPASCTMGTDSFPGVKSGRGVTLTPHLLLVLLSRKSRAIPLLPLWAVRPEQSLSACTSVPTSLLYIGHRVFPEGKERPGRDDEPHHLLVPWSRKSRAIPLLPYGPYGLYRASVPVKVCHPASFTIGTGSFPGIKSGQGATLIPHNLVVPWSRKSRAIPLLPLWAVRPVQSLSACTSVPPSLLYIGYRLFPGGKERPRRDADTSQPYSAVVKKE